MNNYDLNTLITYAFRYALGRKTYATFETAKIIEDHLSELTEQTKETIQKEINEAILANRAGMECDKQIWRDLLRIMQNG